MGFEGSLYYRPGPCPICGKPGGAFRGSSEWYPYDDMVCSEACGLKGKEALLKIRATPRYQRAMDAVRAAEQHVRDLEWSALKRVITKWKEPKP